MSGWLGAAAAGLVTGVLSGFGIGGGTLLLVYMSSIAGVEQRLAQGINLLYFIPAGACALPAHIKNGYVERRALLPAVCTGLLCAGGAAWAATAVDTELLRRGFGLFLIVIGLWEVFSREKNQTAGRHRQSD